MTLSSKRQFDESDDHARLRRKCKMGIGCHVGESSNMSLMPPSSKWPFVDNSDQAWRKSKMVVQCHVGESSDRLSALDVCVCDFRSKNLAQHLRVDFHVGESSDGSLALNSYVTGLQSVELIQRVENMIRYVIQSFNDGVPVPLNSTLEVGLKEKATATQNAFQEEREIAVDWSELQEDVLVRIAENHLLSLNDYAVFSSVCRSWHRAATACNVVKLNQKWIHNQLPWLMLTDGNTETEKDGYSKSKYVLPEVLNDIEEFDSDVVFKSEGYGAKRRRVRGVVNLRTNKCYKINFPEGYGRVCWGSAHGWIVTAGGDGKMFMFNPVTKSRVGLPSFGTFRWRWDNEDEIRRNKFITKAIVIKVRGDDDAPSRGDGLEDLRVVAFYGKDHVAIAKPGSRCWVEIEGPARTRSPLSDVTFDGNLGLIFVDNSGGLLCCNIPEKEESPVLKWLQRPVKSIHDANLHEDYVMTYIVKCGADLLMITRIVQFDENPGLKEMLRHRGFFFVDSYMTIAFVLYKYDFEKKGWVHCSDLKDVALFVGNNASMWVDAPGGGCIYFTDDLRSIYCKSKYKLGGHDCGVLGFHRGDCVKHLYDGKNKRSAYCCPLFFKPSICVPKCLS